MRKGINLHGATRSRIHPTGTTYAQMVDSMAYHVRALGCDFVRMSGTRTDRTTYDKDWPKYGWPKYGRDEHPGEDDYNYNIMAMDVAQAAGCTHFFAGLWTSNEATMELEQELDDLEAHCKARGLELICGIDTEDYAPKRFRFGDYDVDTQAGIELELARRGIPAYRPMMDGAAGPPSRQQRFAAYKAKLAEVHDLVVDRAAIRGIDLPDPLYEVHVYAPVGFTKVPEAALDGVLTQWLGEVLNNTLNAIKEATGARVSPQQLFLGEFSGKQQALWDNTRLKTALETYTRLLRNKQMPCSYQLLGSDTNSQGLVNFKTQQPNRGYEVYKGF